jgi:hypothetical protein
MDGFFSHSFVVPAAVTYTKFAIGPGYRVHKIYRFAAEHASVFD